MMIHRYGRAFSAWVPGTLWRMPTREKVVYLTFDDGPVPEATPFVLETLAIHSAKATFFCVGENVVKHEGTYQAVLDGGHAVGNHTQHHLNGRKTEVETYLADVEACRTVMKLDEARPLFRPPYGRLKLAQLRALKRNYRVAYWEVLSGDFLPNLSAEDCLRKTLKNTRPGSIVLFHDSAKTIEKLRWVLPRYLTELAAQGYRFEAL